MDISLQPLCSTDPMLVLEFSLFALESCPTQTIELFLSGNLPADLVNSYLKQHAPNMQAKYLELMLAMNENSVSTNLQNELVLTFFLSLIPLLLLCEYVCINERFYWKRNTSTQVKIICIIRRKNCASDLFLMACASDS